MRLSNFLWFFGFVYVVFYLNGQIVVLKNQLKVCAVHAETMSYQFNMCKRLYKKGLTCPKN